MPRTNETSCPGCGLVLPKGEAVYDGYYHCTPECWAVYTEALGSEFGDASLFGRVHQLTVDSYALQHAGQGHKDKSIAVHLVGLCLQLEHDFASPKVPARLRGLVAGVESWPRYEPPAEVGPLTVFDVAMAQGPLEHERVVRAWAQQMWAAWSLHHEAVRELTACSLEG